MAHQTYLQLINRVMRQLRETEVSDLSNDYTKLIGDYVNEAKAEFEDSWKWHTLRRDITFDTAIGVREYDLSDGGTITSSFGWQEGRTFLLRDGRGNAQAWRDVTGGDKHRLIEVPRNAGKHRSVVTTDPEQSQPRHFYIDHPEFVFVYEPQEVEQIRVSCFLPQAELTSASTTLTLENWRPIILRATWLALEERGEELGPRGMLLQSQYEKALAQAIAQDISHSPAEMIMDAGQVDVNAAISGGGGVVC